MDASDIIRRVQAQVNYNYYTKKMATTQPTVNTSTNTGTLSTIKIVYPSYAERQRIAEGLYVYTNLSTSTMVPLVNSGNINYKPALPRFDAPII